MLSERKFGVLLPISALPSEDGIGTFGKEAYNFIDYICGAGVKIWQILPLLPLSYGNSPYAPCSTNAFCHYYIDLNELVALGLLTEEEVANAKLGENRRRVDYGSMFFKKTELLKMAFSRFDRSGAEWLEFLSRKEYEDFAVFMTLKEKFSYRDYTFWEEYKRYDNRLIDGLLKTDRDNFEFWSFTQFVCRKQWERLKAYANLKGVEIMGDIPIYTAKDGVEMWKYGSELFLLNSDGEPKFVAGVPPDAFSENGQLWGNPVYDWEKMKENGYRWWKERLSESLSVYDIVRLDHFRGFDRYFRVKSGETTAKNGEWADGPKYELFKDFKNAKIVAEDLGMIDDGVRKLMQETGFPGMKVMSFGFNGDPYSEHKPSNYPENCVAYTGTHDNAPLKSLFSGEDERNESRILQDLKSECKKANVRGELKTIDGKISAAIRLLMSSKAKYAVVPFHDLKHFGDEARINAPSSFSDNNWTFRYLESDFDENTKRRLRKQIKKYGR